MKEHVAHTVPASMTSRQRDPTHSDHSQERCPPTLGLTALPAANAEVIIQTNRDSIRPRAGQVASSEQAQTRELNATFAQNMPLSHVSILH